MTMSIFILVFMYMLLIMSAVTIIVLVHMGQVRDAFPMNVYLDVRNPGGSGFWNEGYMGKGREMRRSVYKQPETKVDGSCHS
jgi:hypothetical protein